MAITWHNINAPNFQQSANMRAVALNGIGAGLDRLTGAMNAYDEKRKQNRTDAALQQLMGAATAQELQALTPGIMSSGGDAEMLMKAIQGRQAGLLQNQGTALGNDMKTRELGVFDQNQNLKVKQAEADIAGQGISNKTEQIKQDYLPEALQTEQKQAEANLNTTIMTNKALPQKLLEESKERQLGNEQTQLEINQAPILLQDKLDNSASQRKYQQGILGVSQGNLALNKQKLAAIKNTAAASGKRDKDLQDMRYAAMTQYADAIANGKQPSPQLMATLKGLDFTTTDLDGILNTYGKEGSGSKDSKFSPIFQFGTDTNPLTKVDTSTDTQQTVLAIGKEIEANGGVLSDGTRNRPLSPADRTLLPGIVAEMETKMFPSWLRTDWDPHGGGDKQELTELLIDELEKAQKNRIRQGME